MIDALEKVKSFIGQYPYELQIITFDESTHTASLAAQALGVKDAQIAKTLVLIGKTKAALVVTCGDKKVDQKKLKQLTGEKMKMANGDQVRELTGFMPGGVCPFCVKGELDIFIDISLYRFPLVYAAAGTANSAVPINADQLIAITEGQPADVCS